MKQIFYILWAVLLWTGCSDDDIRLEADAGASDEPGSITLSGLCSEYELPVAMSEIKSVHMNGEFVTWSDENGKIILYVEQNDGSDIRKLDVEVSFRDGNIRTFCFKQKTRDSESTEAFRQQFIRNFGIGFSYDAIRGKYCDQNGIRSQIINLAELRKLEEKEGIEILKTDYSNEDYYEYLSNCSLAEYLQNSNLDAGGDVNLLLYQGEVKKTLNILEEGKDDSFFCRSEILCPKGSRMLNGADVAAYALEYPGLLTSSFRAAIHRIASTDRENVAVIDSFINRYGTHVVISSIVGGRLELQLRTNSKSFTTKYQEEHIAEHTIPLFFHQKKSSEEQKVYENILMNSSCNLNVKGGEMSLLNEAVLNPSFKNGKITPNMLDSWKGSLSFDVNHVNGSNVEMIDMEVYPIWYLIPDDEVSFRVEARVAGTAPQLCELYGNRNFINTSFEAHPQKVTCRMGNFTKTFEQPYVVNVIAANRYVATICKEWIPEIDTQQPVQVAYPIYERRVKLMSGLCLHKGKAYRVGWEYNAFSVKELGITNEQIIYLNNGVLDYQKAGNIDYQESYNVIGYEWPGSIDKNGGLTGTDYYTVHKFLGNFYLSTDQRFSNIPNWTYKDKLPDYLNNYLSYLKDAIPYSCSGISLPGRKGTEYLKNRMVRDEDYQYYLNENEVGYFK